MQNNTLELIDKAILEEASFIDLGNCGLSFIPKDILKLSPFIKHINFGARYFSDNNTLVNSKNQFGRNDFKKNINSLKILLELPFLTKVEFYNCNISIDGLRLLSYLENLTHLDLGANYITEKDLPIISSLQSLLYLNLSHNNINEKGAIVLKSFSNIEYLDISYCNIGDAGIKSILKFKKILWLDISCNNLTDESIELIIKENKALTTFIFRYNRIQNIPIEIQSDILSLREYFHGDKFETNNLVKLVLLGNTSSGKSSFAEFLTTGNYNKKHESTHGIKLWHWKANENLKVNIWDFGGQDYFHATHNLFLGDKTLYILFHCNEEVHGNSTSELDQFHSIKYWLGNLDKILNFEMSAENSSKNNLTEIWYVQNKKDVYNYKAEWVENDLVSKYNINQQHHISLREAFNGLAESESQPEEWSYFLSLLKKKLQEMSSGLLQESWIQIRDIFLPQWKLEGRIITREEFSNKCKLALYGNLDVNFEFYGLVNYLEGCGEIVVFENRGLSTDLIFMGVDILSEFIYDKILNKKVKNDNGVFDIGQNTNNFNTKSMFLELLLKYKLIFKNPKISGQYIAPQFLPENLPIYQFKKLIPISYSIKFNGYLSRALITSFISEFAANDAESMYWRYGIYFQMNQVNSIVLINTKEQIISVHIEDKKGKYDLMRRIFKYFLELNDEISPNDKISKQQISNIFDYSNHATKKQLLNDVELSTNEVDFASLKLILDGISNGAKRVKNILGRNVDLNTTIFQLMHHTSQIPKKIFFSYSKKDAEYLNELDIHFAALKRSNKVDTWSDVLLFPGQEWSKEILNKLEMADIVLLLLSPDFMATDYVWNIEIPKAIRANKKIVPIFLRPCDWYIDFDDNNVDESRRIDKYSGLPHKGEWIVKNSNPNRDELYLKVVEGIKKLL